MRIGLTRVRSAAVKTRPRASGGTEIDLIRAWACGLRTKATSIVPVILRSATNCALPCRCLTASLPRIDAPTPTRSSGIVRLPAQFLCRLGDRSDDVGVAGATADVAGELLADLALRPRASPQDQVARSDQHGRRAVAALQCVVLVKIASQRLDHAVAGKALDRNDLALITRDCEHQARARRLAVDEDRTGAADAVLAAEMRAGQIAAIA